MIELVPCFQQMQLLNSSAELYGRIVQQLYVQKNFSLFSPNYCISMIFGLLKKNLKIWPNHTAELFGNRSCKFLVIFFFHFSRQIIAFRWFLGCWKKCENLAERKWNPFCCFWDLLSHLAAKLSSVVQVVFCHLPLSSIVPLGDSGQLWFYASHL